MNQPAAISHDLHAQAMPFINLDTARYRSVGFLRSVERAVRQHGPILRLGFEGGSEKVLLARPEISDAWRRNSRALVKDVEDYPAPASLARMILDNNLTTAREGSEWEAMRAQVSPLMRPKMVSYSDAITKAAAQMVDSLSDPDCGKTLWDICGTWSASTVCQPVLGMTFHESLVLDMVDGLRETMFHLVQASADMPQRKLRQEMVLQRLRTNLAQICSDAIAVAQPHDDTMVATLLRDRQFPFGTPPSPDLIAELQPILIGALAAAVHNNSLAMFWLMTNIAKSPNTAEAVAREAAKNADVEWTLKSNPVALAVVRESLRLYPVLPFIERKAMSDLTLDGIAIAAGETVIFAPWFVHRNPEVWPDPLSFQPSRFAVERVDLTRWFPFGLGHRACIGSNLALSQLTRSITTICTQLRFKIPEDAVPVHWQPSYRVLLEPRENGGRLTVTKRPR